MFQLYYCYSIKLLYFVVNEVGKMSSVIHDIRSDALEKKFFELVVHPPAKQNKVPEQSVKPLKPEKKPARHHRHLIGRDRLVLVF